MTACASLSTLGNADEAPLGRPSPAINATPQQADPVADAAYDLMVAEIALNQGDTDTAIERYRSLSQSQDNPAIAERARASVERMLAVQV